MKDDEGSVKRPRIISPLVSSRKKVLERSDSGSPSKLARAPAVTGPECCIHPAIMACSASSFVGVEISTSATADSKTVVGKTWGKVLAFSAATQYARPCSTARAARPRETSSLKNMCQVADEASPD